MEEITVIEWGPVSRSQQLNGEETGVHIRRRLKPTKTEVLQRVVKDGVRVKRGSEGLREESRRETTVRLEEVRDERESQQTNFLGYPT